MSFRLREIIKDPDKRAILSWLGGGAVVVAGGIWTVLTFVVEHKDASGKKDGTNITVSGQGIASGGNTNIGGNVTIGPNKEQIEQIQKPLAEQLGQKDAQIAALTKMLLEKNPSAAGPGAQQAVGGAVQSIAQGAAEGDSRLRQALGLLKENKIAEATQLLNAVAAEKTAHAEQATQQAEKDRNEAAIAYRNLGAIAGLADPKRALEAYEKAVALDPDDVDSLYRSGAILIEYGNLNKAQTRLERVLALAKTGDQAFYQYWALTGLGDIKQKRGDLTGALKAFSDGLAFIEPLAKADPGDAGWQRDLSVSNERLGDIFLAQGNLPAALEQYRASLERMVPIRDRDPSNADLQRFTSVTLNKVGGVQEAPGALKSYQDGLAIAERLAKSDPGNAGWQRDLSASFGRLASVYRKSGDNPKTRDALRQGREIMARLTKLSPDTATWKKDLAWFDGQIAELAPRLEHGRNPRNPLSRR